MGSAVSVILECEAREPHTPAPFSLAVFTLAPDLSFEYGPSLAFAKNTTVLQSKYRSTASSLFYSVLLSDTFTDRVNIDVMGT